MTSKDILKELQQMFIIEVAHYSITNNKPLLEVYLTSKQPYKGVKNYYATNDIQIEQNGK